MTLGGLPIRVRADRRQSRRRQVLIDLIHDDPILAASRPGHIMIEDKSDHGPDIESSIAVTGILRLRRARKG